MILYKTDIIPIQWTFLDYGSGDTNKIEEWYQALSEDARNYFDATLKNISKTEIPNDWIGWRGFIQGKCKEKRIWELGFFVDKLQHRVLGVFGSERRQAILLIGCYHKQRKYTPREALETAYKRATQYQNNEVQLYERKIKSDF